jgi:outer membrane protein OmpA-like peptidoglycan-associated protein
MKRFVTLSLVAGLALTSLTACTTPGKKTAVGAGAGAATGAVIGGVIGAQSGKAGKGALIGAAAGALIGGTIGNRLDKQAKELAKVAETRRTEEGILVNMKGDILFDTGKATLKPEAVDQINQVGAILAKYPEDRIMVIGHTDNVGDDAYNQRLSENRAKAVKMQLLSAGVPSENITTEGMGESQPIASNSTVDGKARNRRVEMKITIPESK